MVDQETLDRWERKARENFVGRKIVAARYMTEAEAEEFGWDELPVVLQLDDGTIMFPSRDDEGNGGGALFAENGAEDKGMPVLYR